MSDTKEPTRRSSRNTAQRRYDMGDDDGGLNGDPLAELDDDEKKRGRPKKTSAVPGTSSPNAPRPKIDTSDKKRGRPSKEIAWDPNYTGPLRRCAYVGHDDLWGPDVPADLQPQYFYSTTARCIYCYKHLCNERHANKSKDNADGTGGSSTGKKKKGKKEDEDITPTRRAPRSGSKSKRTKNGGQEEEEWSSQARRPVPAQPRPSAVVQAAAPPVNFLHTADVALRAFEVGPRILQEWVAPPVATMEYTFAGYPEGSQGLQLKIGGVHVHLHAGAHAAHGSQSLLINATPAVSCVGWVSSDMLVIAGGSTIQVWAGLHNFSAPHLMYSLVLEGGNLTSFVVLPRSGIAKVRFAAIAAVHTDGRVRLHSLPVPNANEQQPLMMRQLQPSPITPPFSSPVQSLAVSTHTAHPNRIIMGHADGSLRWLDLPTNPGAELPPCQGNGGSGFSIAAAGYLPTSDAAFWAVGESASVAIGDIREPFGGPVVPPGSTNSESHLKTADSSVVFPALIAGGDGGHIWSLPWAGEHSPAPRLLASLNGAALSIKCHPFLPISLTGCASGSARALWLPFNPQAAKNAHQLIVHATGWEDRSIVIDSPSDLADVGFRNAGGLACNSVAWAPDLDGRYAVAHSTGLVRVGTVREFILRSATK